MSKGSKDIFNVDDLLNSLFPPERLSVLFDQRVLELGINPTKALDIVDIEYRALQTILHGTSPRVDVTNFVKLAAFLKVSKEVVIKYYFEELERNFPELISYPAAKIEFINANFDLAALYNAGFIKSISNYPHIEEKINTHFGFNSIFDYKMPSKEAAFSAGVRQPKNLQVRGFWINSAIEAFEEFNNPYPYEKEALMNYFPEIRWHSTNVNEGLVNVISDLYKLGVTVFYQSSLASVHLRGATLCIYDKPCIVITDYKGYYSTLWHTLCHELSHVFFDFEEIKKNRYHISDDEASELSVSEKEKQANEFARGFLFSREKLAVAKAHINNRKFLAEYAEKNQVHISFIYTYYAWDFDKQDPKAWARAANNNPSFTNFIQEIENPWTDSKPIKEHVADLKKTVIYQ